MYKKIVSYFVVIFVFIFSVVTIYALSTEEPFFTVYDSNQDSNFSYIEQQFLNSSRFTQKNMVTDEQKNNFLNNYQVTYDDPKFAILGFELVLENDNYQLYFENDSYSVVLIEKNSGITWSSRAEFQQFTDGNNTARNLMNSGIWIDTVKTSVVNYNQTTTSLYDAAGVKYRPEGEVSAELRPYEITDGSYDKSKVEVKSNVITANNTIKSNVNFKALKISFDLELRLTATGINVTVINDSIKEDDQITKLTNIYVLPYFGSTREDKVPGYFMVPDGVGALIKLNQEYSKDFNARFYGNDYGYSDQYLPELSLPIFGIVHLENYSAMYATVNQGAENTVLQGRFWGKNSRYFRMNARFIVRQVYKTVIDRQGNGYDSILDQRNTSNFEVDYKILINDEANYVGIASDYQAFLVANKILTKREITGNGIPLHINYLMSDREASFLGTKKVTMSTVNEVMEIYGAFKDAGISNQIVNLLGYSTSGNLDRAPYKMNFIESEKNFKKLIEMVVNDGNDVYLENHYITSSSLNNRISYNKDVSRNISKVRMSYKSYDLNDGTYNFYLLYPDRIAGYISKDILKTEKVGFSGLTIDDETNLLYSYYKSGNYYDRTKTLDTYNEVYKLLDNVQMRFPHYYALQYAKTFLDVPITNSQYDYYSDLIPLIPLVLKGYISYFTPNLNFNALGKERLLMMVDFGLNPSYILTYSPTFKMRYTMSYIYYSTSFSDYETEIVESYNYLNAALKEVVSATIVERNILDTGVVEVKYSNNVKIYINYTSKNVSYNGVSIAASDYKVVK